MPKNLNNQCLIILQPLFISKSMFNLNIFLLNKSQQYQKKIRLLIDLFYFHQRLLIEAK